MRKNETLTHAEIAALLSAELNASCRRWFVMVGQMDAIKNIRNTDELCTLADIITRKADILAAHIVGIRTAAHALGVTDACLSGAMDPLPERLPPRAESEAGA